MTESDKVSVQNTIASDRDEDPVTVASATNESAGTSYFPSSSGQLVGNRPNLSFVLSITDVTSVAFEVSNDQSTWVDQTEDVIETGSNGHAKTYFTAGGTAVNFAPKWTCGWKYFRLAVVYPDATNVIAADVIARAIV